MATKTATKKKAPAAKATVKKVAATKAVTKKTKAAPKKSAPKKQDDVFAVIQTGGKQYVVSPGDVLKIEKIIGDHSEGDTIVFDEVLLVDDGSNTTIGDPTIKGAQVTATINTIGRAKKVDVVKYRAKSRYFKRKGHRQPFFEVTIESIK